MPRAGWGSQSRSGRSQCRSSNKTLQFRRPEHPGPAAAPACRGSTLEAPVPVVELVWEGPDVVTHPMRTSPNWGSSVLVSGRDAGCTFAMRHPREAVVANVFISHTGADIGWAR